MKPDVPGCMNSVVPSDALPVIDACTRTRFAPPTCVAGGFGIPTGNPAAEMTRPDQVKSTVSVNGGPNGKQVNVAFMVAASTPGPN
jgi:hypothetical protein